MKPAARHPWRNNNNAPGGGGRKRGGNTEGTFYGPEVPILRCPSDTLAAISLRQADYRAGASGARFVHMVYGSWPVLGCGGYSANGTLRIILLVTAINKNQDGADDSVVGLLVSARWTAWKSIETKNRGDVVTRVVARWSNSSPRRRSRTN